MNEFPANLWAPWRMEYISGMEEDSGCFICRYRDEPAADAKNHVLWRSQNSIVLMNRFPYTNGHLLVAALDHLGDFEDLSDAQLSSLIFQTRDAKRVLQHVLGPHGFNMGINLGRCAGAGLPGHIHLHIVPRWNGDTNFMSVLGDVRVIPQALDKLYDQLKGAACELGLPKLEA